MPFVNIMGKGENAGTLHKVNFNFWVMFILWSANPPNLDWSKILSFGKELSDLE